MTRNITPSRYRTIAITSTVVSAILLAGSMILPGYSAPQRSATVVATVPGSGPGFADLIEQVQPSVVTIEVNKAATPRLSSFNGDPRAEEFLQRFFGFRGQAPQQPQRRVQGVGSGFIVDSDGYIVTNNHVVSGAETVLVRLFDDRQFTAEVVGYDEKTDLAVLKIDADELVFSTLGDSDTTRVGDWVVAIGNPFGLGGTATAGIVSARGRDIRSGPYDDFMQIDAPINRGNSGGPVFNLSGEVVGVNTAIYSPNGGSVGIGFAIPANQVRNIVAELKDNGAVDRGWLGVQLQDVDADLAEGLGMDSQEGALVADVVDDSPAQRAGIEVGDVIVSYGGDSVKNAKSLSKMVGASDSGDKVNISVWRNSDVVKMKVKLGDSEALTAATGTDRQFDDLGLTLAPLTDSLREQLGIEDMVSGAVVMEVEPGSDAAEHGLRRGDVVVQANRQPITSPRDFSQTIRNAKEQGRRTVPVLVRRGGIQQFTTLPVA